MDFVSYLGRPYGDLRGALAAHFGVTLSGPPVVEEYGYVLEFTDRGVEAHLREGRVDTIFLYLQRETRPPFREQQLVLGVRADMKQAEIEALLGRPTTAGTNGLHSGSGWIKYQRPNAQLHFSFGTDGALNLVSIMRPDWTPGS